MIERIVTTARALHARPASEVVKAASAFQARVQLRAGEKVADAGSVLAVMRLGLAAGEAVAVTADGTDAEAAVEAVARELTTPEDPRPGA